jgi:hypothetical protein
MPRCGSDSLVSDEAPVVKRMIRTTGFDELAVAVDRRLNHPLAGRPSSTTSSQPGWIDRRRGFGRTGRRLLVGFRLREARAQAPT